MRQLYLKNIGPMSLLLNECRFCGELNIHGFYHQLKSAGAVEIFRDKLRAWHRWECKKCGKEQANMFRLTSSTRRPRCRLFHWLSWSRTMLDIGSRYPWSWDYIRVVGLWLVRMEYRLPL